MRIKPLLYVASASNIVFRKLKRVYWQWSRHAVSLACPEFASQWVACVALLYLWSFAVVGLRLSEAACVTPVTGVALCCGSDLGARTWPEPTVHIGRLQVRSVASVKVALAAGRPDVAHIACKKYCCYIKVKVSLFMPWRNVWGVEEWLHSFSTSASRTVRFNINGHRIGGWAGTRAGLDVSERT